MSVRETWKKRLSAVLAAVMIAASLPMNTVYVAADDRAEEMTEERVVQAQEDSVSEEGEGTASEETVPVSEKTEETEDTQETEASEKPQEETEETAPVTEAVSEKMTEKETAPAAADPTEAATEAEENDTEQPLTEEMEESKNETLPPETSAEEEYFEDFSGLMSIEALKYLDNETVGATMERAQGASSQGRLRTAYASGELWSFDAYYVQQDGLYNVTKSSDFSLKYQMEFHTSEDLEPGNVVIRIPETLMQYGHEWEAKTDIVPTDIAVPQVTKQDLAAGNYIANVSTPFNCYQENGDLVFVNYRKITAGTNAAFQVLYKNIKLMDVADGTSWSLQPTATVTSEVGGTQTKSSQPLTGQVDTKAALSGVSKTPYTGSGQSYTPGLYTQAQVEKYIDGRLPEQFSGDNFKNYKYVVWNVDVKGSANQPWSLYVSEENPYYNGYTSNHGYLVGYKGTGIESFSGTADSRPAGEYGTLIKSQNKSESVNVSFYVVTAYPADVVIEGTSLSNSITAKLVPADGLDAVSTKTGWRSWNYENYDWKYSGNVIKTGKNSNQTYSGWLEMYKVASELGEDKGNFPFSITSECRGYAFTHYCVDGEEFNGTTGRLGEYKENTYYEVTTVDDVLFATSSENASDVRRLSGADYYFSSVSVSQKDTGYDVWEDATASPEKAEDVSQTLKIYAMFADRNADAVDESGWELVTEVPWNGSGTLSYSFTSAQIARMPYRVKAVHDTVNYKTDCAINVQVRLRHDSPVLHALMEAYPDAGEIAVENLCGTIGQQYIDGIGQGWFNTESASSTEKYGRTGLKDFTARLYDGQLIQRDNAFLRLTAIEKKAAAYKTAKAVNDVNNSRVKVNYCLTAYDGYQLYGEEAIGYLRGRIESPGRNAVEFYDLLPYGLHFDPSVAVTAGRITNLSGAYTSQSKSWSASQIQVTVDTKRDIIENWNGTGRTMVIFHVDYSGADPAAFTSGLWMEGWGVSFGAYYEWKDLDIIQNGTNISAFMPASGDTRPLLGKESEVARDDGVIVPADSAGIYGDFTGGDINGDGVTDIRNVLYARAASDEDIVLANESTIRKLVRADADRFAPYLNSAVVGLGEGYTYDLTVSAAGNRVKDIVVFDRLENAANDRSEVEVGQFEDNPWHGSFRGVVTRGLEDLGIAPVVYYNASRSAAITSGEQKPSEILTTANGWYTASTWPGTLEDVQAVAVDLSHKQDGSEFVLEPMESASFQIRMIAPEEMPEAVYAYNNPSWYSYTEASDTSQTVTTDSVAVQLAGTDQLEVEKRLEGEAPEELSEESFEFRLTQKGARGAKAAFANQEYELWAKDENGEWQRKGSNRLYATDANGRLILQAGQKAVFPNLADASRVIVEEEENPLWKTEYTDETSETENGSVRSIVCVNTYRPVLYVQKKLQGVPTDKADLEEITDAEFTFRILTGESAEDLTPLAEAEFWYVDSVRTDGGIPTKLKTGKTDGNGEFTIKAGEIIALLFANGSDTSYQLVETAGAGEDTVWVCRQDTVFGTVPVYGAEASITNIYRWKDLYLTKAITHQDAADCTQAFTFQVTDVTGMEEETDEEGNLLPGTQVSGKRWVVLDESGAERTGEGMSGTLSEDGTFTCACAGATVKIEDLEAQHTYRIQETESGEYYQPVNGGIVDASMPLYSSSKSVTITNDYLYRPISVTKMVVSTQTDAEKIQEANEREFTMTISVEGEPLANYPYEVTAAGASVRTGVTDEEGSFTIKNGETATFQEVGLEGTAFTVTETQDEDYPQIIPADAAPYEGEIIGDGGNATIVNGDGVGLMLCKEYIGLDEIGQYFVDHRLLSGNGYDYTNIRSDFAVSLKLEVTDEEGNTWIWPKTNTSVYEFDPILGIVRTKTWYAGSYMRLPTGNSFIIPKEALQGIVSYSLSESAGDQHRYIERENRTTWLNPETGLEEVVGIEIHQAYPKDDAALDGTIEEQPVATLVNEVSGLPRGSKIWKRMLSDRSYGRYGIADQAMVAGSKLIWRVERFDGGQWKPAENIPYVLFYNFNQGSGGYQTVIDSDRILRTDASGEIVLEAVEAWSDVWCQSVEFLGNTVYINLSDADASEGDLRVVELLDKSDPSWGYLVGYRNGDTSEGYDLNLSYQEATTFVNTTQTFPVEIAKEMDGNADEVFTMILRQVTETSDKAAWIASTDQITGTKPGSNIPYTVYDISTGEQVGTGTTDKNGYIKLRAGQYARLNLPNQTLWTVSEQLRADYPLEKMTGNTENSLTKLESNLMLINQASELRTEGEGRIAITKKMVTDGVIDADTGNLVNIGSGNVTIPARILINGKVYTVVGIADGAYRENRDITHISFPNTLEYIGVSSFYGCFNLRGNLVIPENVRSIGNSAFYYCNNLSGNLTIPASVKSIGNYAFYDCGGLTGPLVLKEGLVSIGEQAFRYCTKLTGNLVIPDSVTEMGAYAFYCCWSLNGTLTIGKGLTAIPSFAFYRCAFKGNLTIPDGVTAIGEHAFEECSGFGGSLVMPDSVTSIGRSAFDSCRGFTGTLKIPEKVKEIPDRAFYNCARLTGSLIIPEGVTSIGALAFYNCQGLSGDLVIPDSVSSIGNFSFDSCIGLTGALTIGSGVTTIGANGLYSSRFTSVIVNKPQGSISGSPWGWTRGTVVWNG